MRNEHFSTVEVNLIGDAAEDSDQGSSVNIFSEILMRFLRKYVFSDGHGGVSRATQGKEEAEPRFYEPFSRMARK